MHSDKQTTAANPFSVLLCGKGLCVAERNGKILLVILFVVSCGEVEAFERRRREENIISPSSSSSSPSHSFLTLFLSASSFLSLFFFSTLLSHSPLSLPPLIPPPTFSLVPFLLSLCFQPCSLTFLFFFPFLSLALLLCLLFHPCCLSILSSLSSSYFLFHSHSLSLSPFISSSNLAFSLFSPLPSLFCFTSPFSIYFPFAPFFVTLLSRSFSFFFSPFSPDFSLFFLLLFLYSFIFSLGFFLFLFS